MNRKERRASKGSGTAPNGGSADAFAEQFQQGVSYYRAGHMAEANQIFGQILAREPSHADSLHMLGLMALDLHRPDIAEDMIRKAIAVNDRFFLFHYSLANVFKAQNKFADAITSYKRALVLNADFADAYSNMGLTQAAAGKTDDAIASYKQALKLNPSHIEALNNLGLLSEERKNYPEAQKYYQQAIKLNPTVAALHFNLGNIFKAQNKFEEAINAYKEALTHDEKDADILVNLGLASEALGWTHEAIEHYLKAIDLNPEKSEALYNLGNAYKSQGKLNEAFAYYTRAVAIKPYAQAYSNMGVILHERGMTGEAIANFQKSLAINPNSYESLNGLGIAYNDMGKFEEAIDCYTKSLALNPTSTEVLGNLAIVHKSRGELDQSIECFRQALAINPNKSLTYNNLLGSLIYASSATPQEISDVAKSFGRIIADPLLRTTSPVRDINPDRKLRIGYVSPDFRNHAVNYFFEPLLKAHDRDQFEVFAYSNTSKEDQVTERLKKEFDHWHNICYVKNDDAADLIEKDKIDILVDLTGHTADNRLLVFARKPAPVQVTWLGYPATTGMKAMDYRITDPYAEPPGMTEHWNTETLWRLPSIFCCYQPHPNSPAVIDHPPFEDNGHITFGCFNNFSKVSDPALTLWARIMQQVPQSRLLLEIFGIDDPKFRTETEARLLRLGLPLDRVDLELRKPANQFVLYNKIDIALDPFPCVGGTTSMDTMWMGVPLVTLAGEHFLSRMGVTILNNVGLPELVAETSEDYVRISTDLALDKDRLRLTRHDLRTKAAASPLMNQQGFVHDMEQAYRGMWKTYCATIGAKP